MSQIEFENTLLQLPLKTRAELAQKLLSSLDEPSEAELEVIWAAEADRRILAAENNEMKRYSRTEMLERVKNALS
jgi:putative addiction module component (TIGR02574 family)